MATGLSYRHGAVTPLAADVETSWSRLRPVARASGGFRTKSCEPAAKIGGVVPSLEETPTLVLIRIPSLHQRTSEGRPVHPLRTRGCARGTRPSECDTRVGSGSLAHATIIASASAGSPP